MTTDKDPVFVELIVLREADSIQSITKEPSVKMSGCDES